MRSISTGMASLTSSVTGVQQTLVIPVTYTCGDCSAENDLRPQDAIRCRECGGRILYKVRPRGKPATYEAR